MKERPIIFSGPMVRAIIEGRKTQTRRVVKWPNLAMCSHVDRVVTAPYYNHGRKGEFVPLNGQGGIAIFERSVPCPYGVPGDRLWCREGAIYWTYADGRVGGCTPVVYQDDEQWDGALADSRKDPPYTVTNDFGWWKEQPPIYMPRRFSRLTLEVVSVRVERLQAISEADKLAEGATPDVPFGTLWKKINIKPGIRWEDNPWVWVVEFKKLEAP